MTTIDRTTPPAPGPITEIRFPSFVSTTLSNGIPVYLVENHEQPLVSVTLYLGGGSSRDTAATQGLASMAAEMLNKGTATRSATEIAETIDFVGGSLGASASWDASVVSTSVLSRYLDTAIGLQSDIVANPVFADEELSRIKTQRIANIMQAKSDPGYLADVVFSKGVYGDHPYGFEAAGTEASVSAMQSASLREFYATLRALPGAFFIVAGDVTEAQIVEKLSAAFGSALRGQSAVGASAVTSIPALNQGPRITLVEKKQAVQSAIRVGHLGIARNHPDYVPLYVLNMLLGGYFNSRINQNLRERNGFTYGARSYFDARKQTGAFVVSTEVRTDVTAAAVLEIRNEIEAIVTKPVEPHELQMVQQYIIGSFPLSIETPQQVANRIASLVLYDLGADYYDRFRDQVAAVTADDLLRAAKAHLHPDALVIGVSGDANALETELRAFGEVDVKESI
ncbi:MAG: insulinase family protein [Bacteroidetes bacterium]|nr:insulinase family protein [Bacteroidota bacterium]